MYKSCFSAKAEQEIKEFCKNSVNKDKMFKNETEARNWYLQNYQDGMQVCNLYDCPIKTAKEFYGKVNEQTIKKALEQIPYYSENKDANPTDDSWVQEVKDYSNDCLCEKNAAK